MLSALIIRPAAAARSSRARLLILLAAPLPCKLMWTFSARHSFLQELERLRQKETLVDAANEVRLHPIGFIINESANSTVLFWRPAHLIARFNCRE